MSEVKHQGTPHRWGKGETGNRHGRPRVPEVEELRIALQKAKKENNKSFLEHFVQRAYRDDTVAIALAKKILPDKLETELKDYDIRIELIKKYGDNPEKKK